jgi:transposase-like protein
MGQVLHGCATTTEAVRRAIQHSQASLRELERRYGVNPKTVAKWRKRTSVADQPTGPKAPRSTILSAKQEAIIVAFRHHTLLPPDDCLYALQATIPQLTRSSLHRCLQRLGVQCRARARTSGLRPPEQREGEVASGIGARRRGAKPHRRVEHALQQRRGKCGEPHEVGSGRSAFGKNSCSPLIR